MTETPRSTTSKKSIASLLFKVLTWLLSIACFYLVYTRIDAAAGHEGITVLKYLQNFFTGVNWWMWLGVMIPYSFFFFLVDTHVTWRAVRWFNAPQLGFSPILPIRASAYILALVNEQVGKGAMSLYLLRTHQVPGWQALSTMIFIGIVEIYQLLMFSTLGLLLRFDYVQQASTELPLDIILPCVLVAAFLYFPFHIAYFRGYIFKGSKLREIGVLHALRNAKIWHYALAVVFKAPNLIGAVIVYTIALGLFQVDASVGQMLIFLPLIFLAAAIPLPFHAGALVLWTVLFPDYPEVGVFSLVMHTFFVIFNALIGVAFLPRANKELFG